MDFQIFYIFYIYTVLHFCISAFLHFCISALRHFWQLRTHLYISAFLHFRISAFMQVVDGFAHVSAHIQNVSIACLSLTGK